MSHWDAIRARARECRDQVSAVTGHASATALLRAAETITEVSCEPVSAGDALLGGGEAVLDREATIIWYTREVEPWRMLFVLAHEFAHFWLGDDHGACSAADIDADLIDGDAASGAARVVGYGPRERREREANIFALEFLLPTDLLRNWYLTEGLDAPAIAARVGLEDWLVAPQLSRALLLPVRTAVPPMEDSGDNGLPILDAGQAEAAFIPHGPLLLEAGPGTGKTRTLVARLGYLLEQGVAPSAILALTFSNKAAEEMRQRAARAASQAALGMWMGTFHAFGLDLLRKFGTRLGLSTDPTILDPIDARFLLERKLPELGLVRYQNLYEPTTHLGDLLDAISRAKDEQVGPAEYQVLALLMREAAGSQDEIEAAEKALETARVYTLYQGYLERQGLLDFGDLIFRAVELLRSCPDVRAQVRATYQHVLVDEYQDVNRASGLLLHELVGHGEGLWVVGDARQAIYRWRGAAPANMRLFKDDFPNARVYSLKRNYRSLPHIVEVVAALVPHMRATEGESFTAWEVERPAEGGRVRLEIAEDEAAEGEGLAGAIEHNRGAGIPYHEQAVLCRSHTALARLATALERAGIPTLYLGNLFERAEIRDLLSLLSLACEGDGQGLVRVAQFAEYNIPLADVRRVLSHARREGATFPGALSLIETIPAVSARARRGLTLLAEHLDGISNGTSPARLLNRYLFSRGAYLRSLLADTSVGGDQRRMAVYQFLQFVREWRGHRRESEQELTRALLRHVRQLRAWGEDRGLWQLPDWADSLEAVRLLTIHAGKGLEFSAVYLPGMGNGRFPSQGQARSCPPPVGMLAERRDESTEEEECLFFVALSRARDVLCLSRAQRYGRQNSNPSTFLAHIGGVVPHPAGITWPGSRGAVDAEHVSIPRSLTIRPRVRTEMLDLYIACPRQYFYETKLGLSGDRDDTAYVRFHRCVYVVLRWIQEERAAEKVVDPTLAETHLMTVWQADGPVGHPYEEIYWRNAEQMVARAVDHRAQDVAQVVDRELSLELEHGQVRFRPDYLEVAGEGAEQRVLAQHLRTGKPSDSEGKKDIYAVYQQASAEAYPDARITVQALYLATDQTQDVRMAPKSVKTRLDHYNDALAGIREGRFPARPNERRCPRCPHYFICPTGSDPLQ